jgi:hypothetical protein
MDIDTTGALPAAHSPSGCTLSSLTSNLRLRSSFVFRKAIPSSFRPYEYTPVMSASVGEISTPLLHAETSKVYARGDVLGLANFLEGGMNWDLSDLVTVTSSEPCYTVEVDRVGISEVDWATVAVWVARVAAALNENQMRRELLHPNQI